MNPPPPPPLCRGRVEEAGVQRRDAGPSLTPASPATKSCCSGGYPWSRQPPTPPPLRSTPLLRYGYSPLNVTNKLKNSKNYCINKEHWISFRIDYLKNRNLKIMIRVKIKNDAYWRKILITTFQDQPTIQFGQQYKFTLIWLMKNKTKLKLLLLF